MDKLLLLPKIRCSLCMPLAILVICCCMTASSCAPSCSQYQYCPVCPEPTYIAFNTDNIAYLNSSDEGSQQFISNFQKAISVLAQFPPGLHSNDTSIPHITVQYLCCYNLFTFLEIADVISKIEWDPLEVRYTNSVICNIDNTTDPNSTRSIILPLDPPSQTLMSDFVTRIETEMSKAGIPLHMSRADQAPFHTTLAVVDVTYPIEEAFQKLSVTVPQYSGSANVIIREFIMEFPPKYFDANGTSPSSASSSSERRRITMRARG